MSHQNPFLANLLSINAQWAADVEKAEPGFFTTLAQGQSPKVLWIGCADSRVPETVITGGRPGDFFVQRNVANQFHLDDVNALAVLDYAVDHLKVEHVIVVGHTECGGATACFKASQAGIQDTEAVATLPSLPPTAPLNLWLAPLTKLAASLRISSTPISEAIPILVEENVKAQVDNLAKTETLINAWAANKKVWVHGWVFEIGKGKLKDLGVSRGPTL